MNIEDIAKLEHHVDRYDFSSAINAGRIRTNEDVKKDNNYLIKHSFYLHLNPFNYFKKEKPLFWNLWRWSKIKSYFFNQ